jgi:hypothetical protein
MRRSVSAITLFAVIAITICTPAGRAAAAEAPPFNLEVILRDVAGGSAFGHVKFRQPVDAAQIVYLDTWVRDLSPDHSYVLRRAVDTELNGVCTSGAWLALGRGMTPREITTDDRGTGREALFRSLAAVPAGMQFDIHFQVIDPGTLDPVLQSGCYRFTVR